jgi:hypothetical protein
LRAAKMHRARGGGSMSLLPLVPGRPATGARSRKPTLGAERATVGGRRPHALKRPRVLHWGAFAWPNAG